MNGKEGARSAAKGRGGKVGSAAKGRGGKVGSAVNGRGGKVGSAVNGRGGKVGPSAQHRKTARAVKRKLMEGHGRPWAGNDRTAARPPGDTRRRRQSEAIRSNQKQSEAIRSNPKQSEAIRSNQALPPRPPHRGPRQPCTSTSAAPGASTSRRASGVAWRVWKAVNVHLRRLGGTQEASIRR